MKCDHPKKMGHETMSQRPPETSEIKKTKLHMPETHQRPDGRGQRPTSVFFSFLVVARISFGVPKIQRNWGENWNKLRPFIEIWDLIFSHPRESLEDQFPNYLSCI